MSPRHTRTNRRLTALALLAAAAAAPATLAGPLTPPAGPVAATHKTLTQVEPRIPIDSLPAGPYGIYAISQPGSYYLTRDLTGAADKAVIEIRTGNVTIDLNGFGLYGSTRGIAITVGASNITIRNGTVGNMNQRGIDCASPSITGVTVENVRVQDTGGAGIAVSYYSTVRNCLVLNAATGIQMSTGSAIESCTVVGASASGYLVGGACRLSGCMARSCTTGFSSGISGSKGSTFTACLAEYGTDGFNLAAGVTLDACTAVDCADVGIQVADACEIRASRAQSCSRQGIITGANCVVARCTAIGNSTSGASYAGIWINGSGCRVEDNTAISNGYGLYVSGTDNFVVRNIARANGQGNYNIAAGNEAAPVVTNPGTNTFTTMTPWSNVAY